MFNDKKVCLAVLKSLWIFMGYLPQGHNVDIHCNDHFVDASSLANIELKGFLHFVLQFAFLHRNAIQNGLL